VQKRPEGEIDWSKEMIKSVGFGAVNLKAKSPGQARLLCIRAAQVVAQRNLLEVVKGVNISSETTVENFVAESDVIKTKVSGVLRGAQQLDDPTYREDGTCEVTYGMRITGELRDILLPQGNFGGNQAKIPAGPQKKYSGLIIDATGQYAVPAMAPKVLDEDGNEVYGSTYVTREYAVKYGIAGYAKSVDQAKKDARVMPDALVLKAIKATGAKAADLVISNSDAAKFKDTSIDWGFLKECKVIIVL